MYEAVLSRSLVQIFMRPLLSLRDPRSNKGAHIMKVIILAAILSFLGASTAGARTTTTTAQVHYTHAQLRSLIRNAETPADYKTLRNYFSHAAELRRVKVAEEKQEWDRRKAYPTRKYPSPVDSAHYLYDYYLQDANTKAAKAEHYGRLAQRYEQLAQSSTTPY
jgi:hypothetical protein